MEATREAPLFIIGAARSGTTLLERVLNRHSRITIPPETGFFHVLDKLALLGTTPAGPQDLERFLSAYQREYRFSFFGIDSAQQRAALLANATSYEDVFANLMGLFASRTGKPRWGEKTPIHLRYVDRIRGRFPDARFVLVIRDGRGAIASQLRHPGWDWDLFTATRRWAKDARFMARTMQSLDARQLFVLRFEELLGEPEPLVRRLCEFMGEDFEPAMLTPGDDGEPADRENGYYDRPWMQKSTGQIDASRAEAWLEDFSPADLKIIEFLAGNELTTLGYPLIRPSAPTWPLHYGLGKLRNSTRRLRNYLRRARGAKSPGT